MNTCFFCYKNNRTSFWVRSWSFLDSSWATNSTRKWIKLYASNSTYHLQLHAWTIKMGTISTMLTTFSTLSNQILWAFLRIKIIFYFQFVIFSKYHFDIEREGRGRANSEKKMILCQLFRVIVSISLLKWVNLLSSSKTRAKIVSKKVIQKLEIDQFFQRFLAIKRQNLIRIKMKVDRNSWENCPMQCLRWGKNCFSSLWIFSKN